MKRHGLTTPLLLLIAVTSLSSSCRDARLGRLADRILGENIILPDSLELLNPQCVADTAWLSSDGKIKLIIHFPEEYCTGCRLSANNLLDSILYILPSSGFAPMVILGSPDKAAMAAMACAATAVSVCSSTAYSDPVFEANIETLSNGEIITGPVCAWDPEWICVYLEPFYDRYVGIFV